MNDVELDNAGRHLQLKSDEPKGFGGFFVLGTERIKLRSRDLIHAGCMNLSSALNVLRLRAGRKAWRAFLVTEESLRKERQEPRL